MVLIDFAIWNLIACTLVSPVVGLVLAIRMFARKPQGKVALFLAFCAPFYLIALATGVWLIMQFD